MYVLKHLLPQGVGVVFPNRNAYSLVWIPVGEEHPSETGSTHKNITSERN